MSKRKYSSPRWNEPIKAIVIGEKEQTKEERIESKKLLLDILVKDKQITQKEADKKLKDFIENYK